ncbi:uncharacterized protein LOC106767807 isoform X1 [Vigna radiata var. radiata]|uniref:Uncharacterized protein LOC106767807 isoform X1 n=1 Tax=Vigna radiata var. radiata TaxID=3916 RepID=A0A3Q0FA11_VIGRR|nr:uncharacterized protein LOC106767807 isoform X1 [Vigna radiata var. radiata]XP_022639203.1 uncharacterized protein LOC106767807 isoform X1 [Vigna radiata var. radiata]XP_022639204.1 uncharacterized protein LOC106767807 isoform X1 [Vigna radiata var. radiata]
MQRIGKISVILQLSLLSAFLLIFPSYSFLITNRHQGIIHCLFFSSNCSSGAFSLHHLEPSSSSIHQPLVEPFMEFSSCHHGTFVVIFIIFSLERFSAIHIFFRDSQVYSKLSGEKTPETPSIDVSSKEFYGEGYDDNDKRILDMTIINKQLGWNPKTSLFDLMESTLTYQHRTYAKAIKKVIAKPVAS